MGDVIAFQEVRYDIVREYRKRGYERVCSFYLFYVNMEK